MPMKNVTKCIVVIAAVGMLALVGCGKSEDGGSASTGGGYDSANVTKVAFNTVCPLSGDAVEDGFTVDFNGQTVGFCCNDCVEQWGKMDDSARTEMLAKMDGLKEKAGEMGEQMDDKMKDLGGLGGDGHDDHGDGG